jgi:hypothetical protein
MLNHTSWRNAVLLLILLSATGRADEGSGRYLSTDYSRHGTFREAVVGSLAPESFHAQLRAGVSNATNPLNILRYIGATLTIEGTKQFASGRGMDAHALLRHLDPATITGGYLGATTGELTGALLQTTLARALGPIGGVVGFAIRPVLWFLGSSVGSHVGKGLRAREPHTFTHGVAEAMRDLRPVQDSIHMVGDAFGAVIGQALIPIPFVGMVVGGAAGGLVGLLLGKAVVRTKPGRLANEKLHRKLETQAERLEGGPRHDPAAYLRVLEAAKHGNPHQLRSALEEYRGD